MKTCNRAHEPIAKDILRRELRSEMELFPVPTYPDTIVYEAVTEDRAVIFKASDPEGRDPDGIALEAWACEKALGAGVPAPHVLLVDTSRGQFPGSFFVMEKAAGGSLEHLSPAAPDLAGLLAELGSHLRALHEIRLPGFGWLDEDVFRATGEVRGRADTWRHALFEEIPGSLEYLAQTGALTSAEVDQAGSAIEAGVGFVDGWTDGRLLHGDMGLLHVWADPDALRITSLIDFGERSAGDPASDFGDLEGHHLRDVLAGYGPDRAEGFAERISFYALVRAIPWARKWHARGETQVLDWVRHLLRVTSPS